MWGLVREGGREILLYIFVVGQTLLLVEGSSAAGAHMPHSVSSIMSNHGAVEGVGLAGTSLVSDTSPAKSHWTLSDTSNTN